MTINAFEFVCRRSVTQGKSRNCFFFLPGNSAEYGFWVGLKIQVGLITSDFRWG